VKPIQKYIKNVRIKKTKGVSPIVS